MGRGSSLACRPSFWRICSARSPLGLSFNSPTIRSIAWAMSPADRRESRPPRRRGAAAKGATARIRTGAGMALRTGARDGSRALPPEESVSSSSRDAPRIASSTRTENEEARSSRRLRRDVDMGDEINSICNCRQRFAEKRHACVKAFPSVAKRPPPPRALSSIAHKLDRPLYAYNDVIEPKWRNGRRSGLKIRRPKGREGSSPSFGTFGQVRGEPELPSSSPRLIKFEGSRSSPRAPHPGLGGVGSSPSLQKRT